MTENKSHFEVLSAIDCSPYAETKNGFTYLSWAWACATMSQHYPDWAFHVKRFDLLDSLDDVPYLQTPQGFFVEVEVTVEGITRSEILPVLDYKNQPIETPNSFHINTSIKRCLVKAIALHGLGIQIYINGEGHGLGVEATQDTISEADAVALNKLLVQLPDTVGTNLLKWAGATTLEDFPKSKLEQAVQGLLKKIAALKESPDE